MGDMQMKKRLKLFTVVLLCVIIAVSSTVTVNAKSFQERNGQGKTALVSQKAVYTGAKFIQGATLGISEFSALNDICVCSDKIYLLDSNNSRIVVLNTNYTLNGVIDNITYGEEKVDLSTAIGLFVNKKGIIYIADTVNQHVLVVDNSGVVIKKITKPDSPIIPKDLEFKAKKVVEDSDGFIFVLCEGVYYGAMVFDSEYNFCGFFGSNQTTTTIFDAIKNFFLSIFMTDVKQEYSLRALPYEFDDLYESDGFIYTATANSSDGKGQIRKLSYSGINILKRDGESADKLSFGNGTTVTLIDKKEAKEHFIGISVDRNGYIYALESTYGRIFVYDETCNLVTAFGGGMGLGQQIGTFQKASEIAVNGSDVLVLDSKTNGITVFEITDFGKNLYKAIEFSKSGDYDAAYPLWKDISAQDGYNQMAYSGIANYYFSVGEYSKSLSYAKKGYERDIYERAFEQVRRDYLADHFAIIFVVIVLLVAGLIVYLCFLKKKKKGVASYKKPDMRDFGILKTTLLGTWKPIQTATKMRALRLEKSKELNIYTCISFGIMLLFFIGKVLETTMGGFMYVSYDPDTYNSAFLFITTIGIPLLFCVVNWGLCTLFEGKGTFKEITIAVGFALIPQVIYSIFFIISSHFLVYSEQAIITGVSVICILITAVVLLVQLTVVHDYSFFRALGMCVVTFIGMILCAFLILLVFTLFKDIIEFVRSVYIEAVYRSAG